MKALLLSKYNQLEMADFPVPTPGSGEVLVRVAACGICGSDVHGYDGSSGRRIPPIVMGHEAAGTIAALGGDIVNLAENERVTFDSTISCGACEFCKRGELNLCNHREVIGVSCGDYRRAGAFAEYIVVPSGVVYRLPPSISFPEAALLEAVAVAVHAVSLAESVPKRTALVIGAGTIGLLCLQALRVAGCSRIFVADIDPSRLGLAKEFGATTVLSPELQFAKQLSHLTGGEGVDLVVEAVGRNETVGTAIDAVRKGARSFCLETSRRKWRCRCKGGDAANPAAGFVRVGRGISARDRVDGQRRDQREATDHRCCAFGTRPRMV